MSIEIQINSGDEIHIIKANSKEALLNKLFPVESQRVKDGKCPLCAKPINHNDFRDDLSIKEFKIGGMCQQCQDLVFRR